MTKEQAKKIFIEELKEQYNAYNLKHLIEILGKTTIRCYWCDYVEYLSRDKRITEKQRMNWGQII